MTRRQKRQWIRGAGPGDGSSRGWLSDELSDLTVGSRLSDRDLAERGPYLLLEVATVCIEPKSRVMGFDADSVFNSADAFGHGRPILPQLSLRKLPRQLWHELLRRTNVDSANASLRRRDKEVAQLAFRDRIRNSLAAPALPKYGRAHTELSRMFVSGTGRAEASSVDGISDRFAVAQVFTKALLTKRTGILLRTEACLAFE